MAALFCLRGSILESEYFEIIPVTFNPYSGYAEINLRIEETSFLVKLDTGSKPLSLHPDILNQLKKVSFGISRRLDVRGNKYETPNYLIPKVCLGSFFIHNLKAQEESFDFIAKGAVLYDVTGKKKEELVYRVDGRMGLDGFGGRNFLLDFSNDRIVVCESIHQLKQEGFKLDQFIEVPIEIISGGILLKIHTDLGLKRFLLDTGCSYVILRENSEYGNLSVEQYQGLSFFTASTFAINGKDFGPQKILLFPISPLIHSLDGVLGRDFLGDHAIYLDFRSKKAFIN